MMPNKSLDILKETYEVITITDRNKRITRACKLAKAIQASISTVDEAFVYGEAGVPEWDDAAKLLVERKKLHPIEAWMAAEVLATGAVTAHEIATQQSVADEQVHELTSHLALGALRLTGAIYHVN